MKTHSFNNCAQSVLVLSQLLRRVGLSDSLALEQETKGCYPSHSSITGRIRVVGQGRTKSISKTYRAVTRRKKPSKMLSSFLTGTWSSIVTRRKLKQEFLHGFRVRPTWLKPSPVGMMFTPSLHRKYMVDRSPKKTLLKGLWVKPAYSVSDMVLGQ